MQKKLLILIVIKIYQYSLVKDLHSDINICYYLDDDLNLEDLPFIKYIESKKYIISQVPCLYKDDFPFEFYYMYKSFYKNNSEVFILEKQKNYVDHIYKNKNLVSKFNHYPFLENSNGSIDFFRITKFDNYNYLEITTKNLDSALAKLEEPFNFSLKNKLEYIKTNFKKKKYDIKENNNQIFSFIEFDIIILFNFKFQEILDLNSLRNKISKDKNQFVNFFQKIVEQLIKLKKDELGLSYKEYLRMNNFYFVGNNIILYELRKNGKDIHNVTMEKLFSKIYFIIFDFKSLKNLLSYENIIKKLFNYFFFWSESKNITECFEFQEIQNLIWEYLEESNKENNKINKNKIIEKLKTFLENFSYKNFQITYIPKPNNIDLLKKKSLSNIPEKSENFNETLMKKMLFPSNFSNSLTYSFLTLFSLIVFSLIF